MGMYGKKKNISNILQDILRIEMYSRTGSLSECTAGQAVHVNILPNRQHIGIYCRK